MIIEEKEKYKKEEYVLIECDYKSSPKCKNQYKKMYKCILESRANNNGKDLCIYCFNSITKTGKYNYNFKYEKDENFFEIIDTELKAYLLGFIAGDGTITKDGVVLEIHKKDIEILNLFKEHICPTQKFFHHSDPIKGKNTICFRFNSVKIVKDLLKNLKLKTYGKKCDKIQLPDLPDDFQWHFIRGLFDSDGTITSPFTKVTCPISSICSVSDKMRKNIKKFCDKNNVIYQNGKSNFSVVFSGRNCLNFLNCIYNNATFFLRRKYDFYQIWKTWVPGKGTCIKGRKIRKNYPPITEWHKEQIRKSNRKRKGIKYV